MSCRVSICTPTTGGTGTGTGTGTGYTGDFFTCMRRPVFISFVVLTVGSLLQYSLWSLSGPTPCTDTTVAHESELVNVTSPVRCGDHPPPGSSSTFSCLQQALWGKCSEHFMAAGACDRSCGRCASAQRARALSRTLLVSARQSAACAAPEADRWVMRTMANKAEYARTHGMSITWQAALLDAEYDVRAAVSYPGPLTFICLPSMLLSCR